MKTNNTPSESLIKFLPEMKKKNLILQKLVGFQGLFSKKTALPKQTTSEPDNVFE